MICYECGEKGHIGRECPNKGTKVNGKGRKGGKGNKSTEEVDEEEGAE